MTNRPELPLSAPAKTLYARRQRLDGHTTKLSLKGAYLQRITFRLLTTSCLTQLPPKPRYRRSFRSFTTSTSHATSTIPFSTYATPVCCMYKVPLQHFIWFVIPLATALERFLFVQKLMQSQICLWKFSVVCINPLTKSSLTLVLILHCL